MAVSLEEDIKSCLKIIAYCADDDIARDFYRALCNMRWRKKNYRTNDEKIIDKLKGDEPDVWSCTWRYAGGIIASIRNTHHGKRESYIDFYCSGREGDVSPLVNEMFDELGWQQYPWEDEEF